MGGNSWRIGSHSAASERWAEAVRGHIIRCFVGPEESIKVEAVRTSTGHPCTGP